MQLFLFKILLVINSLGNLYPLQLDHPDNQADPCALEVPYLGPPTYLYVAVTELHWEQANKTYYICYLQGGQFR